MYTNGAGVAGHEDTDNGRQRSRSPHKLVRHKVATAETFPFQDPWPINSPDLRPSPPLLRMYDNAARSMLNFVLISWDRSEEQRHKMEREILWRQLEMVRKLAVSADWEEGDSDDFSRESFQCDASDETPTAKTVPFEEQ